MNKSNTHKTSLYQIIVAVIIGSLLVTGCAQIGDRGVSLIPRTKLTDPLEVPPGMSPLPEPEQFVVPGQLEADDSGPPELGPEQLRAYKIWQEFEQFKKYQDRMSGVGQTPVEFQAAKMMGEGLFKVSTATDQEAQTIRLLVHDNVDAVWQMLPSVLADMSVYVSRINNDERTMLVGNTGEKQKFTVLQRIRLKEYSGSIDILQVRAIDGNKTEVIGLTDTNVLVNPKVGREFFERLRFFLLARYDIQDESYAKSGDEYVPNKQLITGDDGQRSIVVAESFETVWIKVGRTLQGAGAGIQDMNRSEGIYYVRFGQSEDAKKKKNRRFRWQFWRPKAVQIPEQHDYQVIVRQQGENTEVSVLFAGDRSGGNYDPAAEQNVLQILYERLPA